MSTSLNTLRSRIESTIAGWRFNGTRWLQSQWGTRRHALKLLRNEAFLELERGIAKAAGDRMAPPSAPWLIAPSLGDELRASGISADEVPDRVAKNRDLMIDFLKALDQVPEDTIEEYDPEEEVLEPSSKPEGEGPLGFGSGFTVLYLIYITYLRDRTDKDLIKFLRAIRVPGAAKYAAYLKSRYQWTIANRSSK